MVIGTTCDPPNHALGPLFSAFDELLVQIVPLPFDDPRIEEVRTQLADVDGLLICVNPIQNGVNRSNVDLLAREASARGLFVSADPSVTTKMGTKEVLYTTRELGWGTGTYIYRSAAEFAECFPVRLASHGRLVVKQGRGNGGDGVWKVELGDGRTVSRHSQVRVQNAHLPDGTSDQVSLGEFLDGCSEYFAWSGLIVDQPLQDRLGEGMLRCYFSHGQVIGFSHQWPRGLLDFDPAAPPSKPLTEPMQGRDVPAYQRLRRLAEDEWVPQMTSLLGLKLTELPVVWDADFLYGPRDSSGTDTFVLSEINVSAVWPFPAAGAPTVAANALARTNEGRER
jgi:hypothetical protein